MANEPQELLALQRRKKLAEALLGQGMSTGPATPLEAVARIFQTFAGQKMGNEADQGFKNFEEGMRQDRQRALGEYMTKMQGQGPVMPATPNDDEGFSMPSSPAVAPDPRGALMALQGSRDPMLQQVATQQMLTQTKPDVFGKVDPEKYTPESLRAFVSSGNDYTKLVPRDKGEWTDEGGTRTFRSPYTGQPMGPSINKTQTPDSVASNATNRWSHSTPSGSAVFQSKLPQLYEGGMSGPMWLTRPQPGMGGGAPAGGGPASSAIPVTGPGGAPIETKASREDADALRKEFAALPEVKNYKEVVPIIKAARNAADTPQGDINLIYAAGKIYDPNSVVREGELSLALKSQALQDKLGGYLAQVTGGGRLTPHARQALLAELNTRVKEHESMYGKAKETYSGIAGKRGYKPEDIFVEIGDAAPQKLSKAEEDELAALRKRFGK